MTRFRRLYFNDLPGSQKCEQNLDEVIFFYVWDLFCIPGAARKSIHSNYIYSLELYESLRVV